MRAIILCLLLIAMGVHSAPTSKVIKLEGISIQGNSEEPQVMYITPWQEPPGTGRLYQNATTFRKQWMHTIDAERLHYDMALPQQFKRDRVNDNE